VRLCRASLRPGRSVGHSHCGANVRTHVFIQASVTGGASLVSLGARFQLTTLSNCRNGPLEELVPTNKHCYSFQTFELKTRHYSKIIANHVDRTILKGVS